MKLLVLDTILIGPLHKICQTITWIGFEPNFCDWFFQINFCFCMFLVSSSGVTLSTLLVFLCCKSVFAVTQIPKKILILLFWVWQWWIWNSKSQFQSKVLSILKDGNYITQSKIAKLAKICHSPLGHDWEPCVKLAKIGAPAPSGLKCLPLLSITGEKLSFVTFSLSTRWTWTGGQEVWSISISRQKKMSVWSRCRAEVDKAGKDKAPLMLQTADRHLLVLSTLVLLVLLASLGTYHIPHKDVLTSNAGKISTVYLWFSKVAFPSLEFAWPFCKLMEWKHLSPAIQKYSSNWPESCRILLGWQIDQIPKCQHFCWSASLRIGKIPDFLGGSQKVDNWVVSKILALFLTKHQFLR